MAGKKKAERLEVVHPDCAGIDVGKRKHYVAERWTPIVGQVGSYFKVVSAVHHMLPD